MLISLKLIKRSSCATYGRNAHLSLLCGGCFRGHGFSFQPFHCYVITLGRLLHTSCVTNSTGQKDITVFSAAGKITMDFSSKHYCKKLNSVSTACSTLVFNAFKVYPCRLHYDSEVLCWQYHSLLIAMTLYSDTYVTVLANYACRSAIIGTVVQSLHA